MEERTKFTVPKEDKKLTIPFSAGTFGFPIIGHIPASSKRFTEHFKELKHKYGNIFTTKWGFQSVVVLADFDLIKKAFNHPDLSGRPRLLAFEILSGRPNAGVAGSDGAHWSEKRRFILQFLRNLGVGKMPYESFVMEEAAVLVRHLDVYVDKPSQVDLSIVNAVLNITWKLLANARFNYEGDGPFYVRMVLKYFKIIEGPFFFLEMFPVLRKVLPSFILNNIMKVNFLENNREMIFKMFQKVIKEHQNTVDQSQPRDLIDHYLLMKQCTFETAPLDPEHEHDLMSIMADIFFAGSETTASSMRYVVLYMALYPEIQAKIHRCLDEVVPKTRLPSLADRDQMPYVNAVLHDLMRLTSVTPVAVLHRAMKDVIFEGYSIPKDTMVIANAEGCHQDPKLWDRPGELHPQHFLDEHGNFVPRKNGFMPFSVGRRTCFGEGLARMELYLFTTAILQRFRIETPKSVTLSSLPDPCQRLVNTPRPFQVVLRKRVLCISK
ncbi:Cytochrome P450 [Trinorchestia longiramus]|nr:Cytochrome P450 [Trinorchestia longiramus]